MTAWIKAPYAFNVIMRQRAEHRERRAQLASMEERSMEEDSELALLTSQANGYSVPIYAGLQEVDDLVASHPIVAKLRVPASALVDQRRHEADVAARVAARAATAAQEAEAAVSAASVPRGRRRGA